MFKAGDLVKLNADALLHERENPGTFNGLTEHDVLSVVGQHGYAVTVTGLVRDHIFNECWLRLLNRPQNNVVENLLQVGAAHIPDVFTGDRLQQLREFCATKVVDYHPRDGQKDSPAAPVSPDEPMFRDAILRGAEVLAGLGFKDVRFLAGALIPKWQGEGRRGWHVDWWAWEGNADAWRETPPQVGLLCYMDPAQPRTGALLAVPGSHRREVYGHYRYWESWDPHPDEIAIPAEAGDAVILDPRMMHAVSANSRIPNRMCLTLWFLIDFEKLQEQTRATTMLSIPPSFKQSLGDLCPAYDGPLRGIGHVKKPQFPLTFERISAIRNGKTDREIIGNAAQSADTFLDTDETYTWYFAVAAAIGATSITEIGVRHGYSAIAMLKGARWAGRQYSRLKYTGVDAKVDGNRTDNGVDVNEWASVQIHREGLGTNVNTSEVRIIESNSNNPTKLMADLNGSGCPSIFHIDGDHTAQGIENEIAVAKMYASPIGLILIDDCDCLHIRAAAEKLCSEYGIVPIWLPTQHTLCVIDMKKRTKFE